MSYESGRGGVPGAAGFNLKILARLVDLAVCVYESALYQFM